MKLDSRKLPQHPLRWWDLACAAVLLFVGVVAVTDSVSDDPTWASSFPLAWRVAIFLAPTLLFAVLYVVLGRATILRGMNDTVSRSSAVFLVLMLVVLAIGAFCDPMYAMLQALIYPIAWTVVQDYRSAVMWCVAVAVAVGSGLYLGLVGVDPQAAMMSSLITATISLVFAISMGTWISRIHAQGETYRELADELRLTQNEVAALSQAAGASAERERLSRDLHDTLTQTLAGLVMLSEQTERALDAGDETRARDRLARVGSAARAAVTEARALVATTQPIGEDGLVSAIERVAAGLRADTGLEVECALDQVVLPRDREVVLLRAVQEGLANARKHAHASKVHVSLEAEQDGVVLRVDDNGVGPGEGSRAGGFGLTGLADRVRAVGGEIRFGAGNASGSRLEVRLETVHSAVQVVVQEN